MSADYWIITGVGIDTDGLYPFIDKAKVAKLLLEQFTDDEELVQMVADGDYDGLDVDNFVDGEPFNCLADMFTFCDDTDSLTYGDDGAGKSFLYYPPSLPWQRADNEPETLQEVHKRLIDAVKKLTTLADSEIESMIDDDLYVVGYD